MPFTEEFIERFWAKVNKDGPVHPALGTKCWLWKGAHGKRGHGYVNNSEFQSTAHRASWVIHRGDIPSLMCVLHKCDNPPCVNPDHLFLGTELDNVRDMIAKGRKKPPRITYPRRILTDAQIVEIRASSETNRTLADRYGVTRLTISSVRNFRCWKNVGQAGVSP